jgi:DNA-binding PadR family transcriptional regulator
MNRYDLIILGLLDEKPQHGYDIKTFVEEHELQRWANINVSSLYNRLAWLSKHDYIHGIEEQVGNRPMRTSFQITETGHELLRQETMEFISGFNDDPRTLGLSFLHVLPRDLAIETVQAHVDYLESEVKRQKALIRERKKEGELLHELSPILSYMSLDHIKVELKYMKVVLEVLSDKASQRKLKEMFDINT